MLSVRCLSVCLSVCLPVCPVLSLTLVYCGQTVKWIKMKLGMQVSFGPSHIVLDGDPAKKGGQQPPNFRPIYCGQTAEWIKMPLDTDTGLSPSHNLLDGNPAPLLQKGDSSPQYLAVCCIFGRPVLSDRCPSYLCVCNVSVLWYGGRPRPRRHCVRWGLSSPLRKGAQQPPHFSARVCCSQTVAHVSNC